MLYDAWSRARKIGRRHDDRDEKRTKSGEQREQRGENRETER
jgi:hypothetical protein